MSKGQKNPNKTITSPFDFHEALEMGEIQVALPPLQFKFLQSWSLGS